MKCICCLRAYGSVRVAVLGVVNAAACIKVFTSAGATGLNIQGHDCAGFHVISVQKLRDPHICREEKNSLFCRFDFFFSCTALTWSTSLNGDTYRSEEYCSKYLHPQCWCKRYEALETSLAYDMTNSVSIKGPLDNSARE